MSREGYEDLDEAVAAARAHADAALAEGPRETVSALRDFEPAQQVVARLEISGKGLFRAPTAGVDVMGDGSLVAFSGGVRRDELEPLGGDPFAAVRASLAG